MTPPLRVPINGRGDVVEICCVALPLYQNPSSVSRLRHSSLVTPISILHVTMMHEVLGPRVFRSARVLRVDVTPLTSVTHRCSTALFVLCSAMSSPAPRRTFPPTLASRSRGASGLQHRRERRSKWHARARARARRGSRPACVATHFVRYEEVQLGKAAVCSPPRSARTLPA